ncbi:MAG: iron ABC transporter permease [Actinomycetota bacterium]
MTDESWLKSADPYSGRRAWFWPAAAVTAVGVAFVSLALGAVDIPLADVGSVLLAKMGLGVAPGQSEAVVWGIRLPRVLLGFLVGATLGLVGAVLQGLLRNDLADPQLLGIGPGAAIGAAIGAVGGGVRGAIAGGVVAGVATSFALRRLVRRSSIDPTRIILSGVALGAMLSAFVGFVVFGADQSVVPPIEFWLLGSLSGATWRSFGTAAVFLLITTIGLLSVARNLDLLALGESEARHLGVDTNLVTTVTLIGCGAAVGVTVGVAGVVAFVGLLVPFLMRPIVGPRHRHLLAASMLGGGIFVVLADLLARTVLSPVEIPVGLITAVVGGPVFLWLLSRKDRHDV